MIALSVIAELQSPYKRSGLNNVRDVRARCSANNLEKAWRERTGQEVPENVRGKGKRQKGEGKRKK